MKTGSPSLSLSTFDCIRISRTLLGVLLMYHAFISFYEWMHLGYFGNSFHLPFLPESFVPSEHGYLALLVLRFVFAGLVLSGFYARKGLLLSALLIVYTLLCNRISFHHNRYTLAVYCFLFSFASVDNRDLKVLSSQHKTKQEDGLWPLLLVKLQLSLIYIASGGSKALDPDWQRGLVLHERMLRHGGEAISKGIPEALMRLLQTSGVGVLLSWGAIGTELFLAFGLWFPRTRKLSLMLGILFHLVIQVTSKVEIFTWLTLSIYFLFWEGKDSVKESHAASETPHLLTKSI